MPDELPGRMSVEDVLALPADLAGIEPLNLEERAGQGRERVARVLREIHGSGEAALPRTIKLAGQVAGLISPVTGQSEVSDDEQLELMRVGSRAARALTFMLRQLSGALKSSEEVADIRDNLRDSADEMDSILEPLEVTR
ncbi:hypothetical protein [Citricoccus sp. I39-566]|uniref:hypothetical protein n=1 Tax=Citricoccus sp. I39-566 TaxID=3073268 RepID=UPI00286BB7F6|nr:hypothetical protein [Citricoccus sp. I39-566]WMY80048.1 hypothetical protein RE421_16670 [Citricoccus sp. I39-566]